VVDKMAVSFVFSFFYSSFEVFFIIHMVVAAVAYCSVCLYYCYELAMFLANVTVSYHVFAFSMYISALSKASIVLFRNLVSRWNSIQVVQFQALLLA